MDWSTRLLFEAKCLENWRVALLAISSRRASCYRIRSLDLSSRENLASVVAVVRIDVAARMAYEASDGFECAGYWHYSEQDLGGLKCFAQSSQEPR